MSAFMQLAKKAAPAPNSLTPVSAAKRHSVVQSGASLLPEASTALPAGFPSKMQQVAPISRPVTCRFHMIQPVELYQWKRSPRELAA